MGARGARKYRAVRAIEGVFQATRSAERIAPSTKMQRLSILPTPLCRVTVSEVAISYPRLPFTNRTVPAFAIGRQHRLLQLWSGQIKRCNVNFPERRTVVTLRTICHPLRHTYRVRRSRQRAPRHAM